MLVNRGLPQMAKGRASKLSIAARLRRDAGSTMVTVLIVMLVLTIGGVALASITMNTASTVTNTRDRSAAQAEVDGGITKQVMALANQEYICDPQVLDQNGVQKQPGHPTSGVAKNGTGSVGVNWTITCLESGPLNDRTGLATIVADSTVGGQKVTREATLDYDPYRDFYSVEGLVFYKGANLTSGTTVGSPSAPVNLVIPSSSVPLDCNAKIWGTVTVFGGIILRNGCEIVGEVTIVTGNFRLLGGSVEGSLTLGELSTGNVDGPVIGNVWVHRPVSVAGQVSGNLKAKGNVNITGRVAGTVTVPTGSTVTGNYGSVEYLDPLVLPKLNAAPPWIDFTLNYDRDWKTKDGGYGLVTVTPGGSGIARCSSWQNSLTGWNALSAQAGKTVINASACGPLEVPKSAVVSLAHDTVVVGNGFDLQKTKWQAAPSVPAGTTPKIWFVTEDRVSDQQPTCSAGQAYTDLFQVEVRPSAVGMIYTPCQTKMGSGSLPWRGSIYSGDFDNGANMNFVYGDICLPGLCDEDRADNILGDLTEMRNVTLLTSRPKP